MAVKPELKTFIESSIALAQFPPRFVIHRNKEPLSLKRPTDPGPHGDPDNQLPLRDALARCEALGATGIGFSVPENFLVVDFDNAIMDGEIQAWVLAILAKVPNTLVEISPSGRGLHAYLTLTKAAHDAVMKADKATAIGNGKVEFLRHGFYSTISGDRHPLYEDKLAELDALGVLNLIDRIKQTARSVPSLIPVESFPETIYRATDEEIVEWRKQIVSGVSLHQPTFMYAWWSAYNGRDKNTTEAELHQLYSMCAEKDSRWEDRKRKISGIVARCYKKAVEFHAKVQERRVTLEQLSEEGSVACVVRNNHQNITYSREAGWLVYNGLCYEVISEYVAREKLFQIYMPVLEDLYKVAPIEPKQQAMVFKYAQSCRSNKTRTAIEMLARGVILSEYSEFDSDPTVLNTPEGVIDLTSGLVLDHDPTFKMVNLTNVSCDPSKNYDTPVFDKFMREFTCGDEELREYVMCALGYSITGETSEHKFFCLYGGGANGKSTLMNVIRDIMGPSQKSAFNKSKKYYGTLRAEALIAGGTNNAEPGNDLATLAKSRFVVVGEVGDRKIKDERLKAIVSADTLQVRFLFREFFELTPQCKIWLQTNQRPRVRGNDDGVWRRAVMIPCNGNFKDNPDLQLGDKLFNEREGILQKLIKYAQKWYRDKLPAPPQAVVDQTNEWREESDAAARFVAEMVVKSPGHKVPSADLHRAWMVWCQNNNERPGTSSQFFTRLPALGLVPVKYDKGTKRGYKDIGLIATADNSVVEF